MIPFPEVLGKIFLGYTKKSLKSPTQHRQIHMAFGIVTVLGGGGSQRFCDDITKALEVNSWWWERGVKNCPKLPDVINGRPLFAFDIPTYSLSNEDRSMFANEVIHSLWRDGFVVRSFLSQFITSLWGMITDEDELKEVR